MKICIPATSANLGPGFDCLGLSLKFFNEVCIEKSTDLKIVVNGQGSNNIKFIENNFFVKIFYEILKNLQIEKQNYSFVFNNNIPFSRGLGSSSAVIVGAIASAYYFAKKEVNKNIVLNQSLKYENHPDNIAPTCLGGFVCSKVYKDEVFSIKKDISSNLKAVIVIPNISMNTNKNRLILSNYVKFKDCVNNIINSSFLTACFLEQKYDLLHFASKDRLHEFKRMKNLPVLFKIQKFALENNALMSTLSGSGSSIFSLVYEEDAIKLKDKFKEKFPSFLTKVFEFYNKGFEIC